MNKKNAKFVKENKYAILAGTIALVLLVAGITVVKADVSFWDKVAQYTGLAVADKIDIPDMNEPTLGAVPSPDVFQRMYFHDGFISESSIDIELSQVATTTAASTTPAGWWCNDTNKDLLVEGNWYLDVQTANALWASSWSVGTTTITSGKNRWTPGTDSFTATTTATLMPLTSIASTATGFYDRDTRTALGTYYDGGGNATTSPWLLSKNVCVVVYGDQQSATSSASYTSAGGWTTFVGGFHIDGVSIR